MSVLGRSAVRGLVNGRRTLGLEGVEDLRHGGVPLTEAVDVGRRVLIELLGDAEEIASRGPTAGGVPPGARIPWPDDAEEGPRDARSAAGAAAGGGRRGVIAPTQRHDPAQAVGDVLVAERGVALVDAGLVGQLADRDFVGVRDRRVRQGPVDGIHQGGSACELVVDRRDLDVPGQGGPTVPPAMVCQMHQTQIGNDGSDDGPHPARARAIRPRGGWSRCDGRWASGASCVGLAVVLGGRTARAVGFLASDTAGGDRSTAWGLSGRRRSVGVAGAVVVLPGVVVDREHRGRGKMVQPVGGGLDVLRQPHRCAPRGRVGRFRRGSRRTGGAGAPRTHVRADRGGRSWRCRCTLVGRGRRSRRARRPRGNSARTLGARTDWRAVGRGTAARHGGGGVRRWRSTGRAGDSRWRMRVRVRVRDG